MTTRAEWQRLAEDRILDAEALLAPAAGRWTAAFYLAGYAVESGLKACVVAAVAARPALIYEDRKFSQSAWTHDFETLLDAARLRPERDAAALANPLLYANWQLIKEWTVDARYLQKTQAEAELLYTAVTHPSDGVMPWIRRHW